MKKKQAAPKQDKGNILNDPEKRKLFKSALSTVTHYFQAIDDHREGAKDSIAAIAEEYGVEKKLVRKLAKTMYLHNYSSVQQENSHFETIYETIIEGKNTIELEPDDLDEDDSPVTDQE